MPGTVGPEIVGGDGCWLLTADGRRILDGAGGAIVANIGHGRDRDRRRRARRDGRRRLRRADLADAAPRAAARHARRALAARGHGPRVLHQWRQRVRRLGDPPRPRLPPGVRASRALEGDRPAPELPRPDVRRPRRRQPPQPPQGLRAAAARLPARAVGRRRGARGDHRAGGRRHDRRLPVRADHRRRRRLPHPVRRLLAGRHRDLPAPRDPDDRRRGDDRLRAHRHAMGLPALPAAARHPLRRQGPGRRLRPDGDGRRHRRDRRRAARQRVHVLHVHRRRRDVRRRRRRPRGARARAPRRAVGGDR